MFTYEYDDEKQILFSTASGTVTLEDIVQTIEHVSNTYSHLDDLYIIVDYSNSSIDLEHSYFLLALEDVKSKVEKTKTAFNKTYAAYVVEANSANEVQANLFKKLFDHYNNDRLETLIAHTQEEAVQWLLKKQSS